MDNQFKDLITALCYDEEHKCYVIPSMALIEAEEKRQAILKGIDDKLWLKPEMNEEQFNVRLEQIWEYCQQTCRKFNAFKWSNSFEVVREVVQAVCYDGNGYAVPCLGAYVNEKPENQVITNMAAVPSIVPGRQEYVPVTDFGKDTVMAKFCSELYANLNNVRAWILSKKKLFGSQIPETTQKLNEDDHGKKLMSQPYERRIEDLLNQQEKQ